MVYLGVTSTPGGNVPSDPALASAIAIPIALGVGMNAEAAIALAVPFGVLGVFMDQLRRTINATWVHMADKYAEDLNYSGIYRAAFLYPALAGFCYSFSSCICGEFLRSIDRQSNLGCHSKMVDARFRSDGWYLASAWICLDHHGDWQETFNPLFLDWLCRGCLLRRGSHGCSNYRYLRSILGSE